MIRCAIDGRTDTENRSRRLATLLQMSFREFALSQRARPLDHSRDFDLRSSAQLSLPLPSREQVLEAYRQVRDELARRIRERFGRPSTFGG